jgi:hypothetical protein
VKHMIRFRMLAIILIFVVMSSTIFVENINPGETKVVIRKPYGERDIDSPGRAIIEYYNPDKKRTFIYEGNAFIQKEHVPGALRDNVFLVRAYDDGLTYEVSLTDIDRFETRCKICADPLNCCSDLTINLRDGGILEGELYLDGLFTTDSLQNEDLQVKPWAEFGIKTERGIVKLRQQSGIRWKDPKINESLNCAFCNAHFGRIVSFTMEWSSEYKKKLKKFR